MRRRNSIILGLFVLSFALVGAWFSPAVQVRLAKYKLEKADSDEARMGLVTSLLENGEAGQIAIVDALTNGPEANRPAIIAAIKKRTSSDPQLVAFANVALDRFQPEANSLVELFPLFLETANPDVTTKVDRAVTLVAERGTVVGKQAFTMVANRTGINTTAFATLLKDPSVDVRRTAVVALGASNAFSTEELFPLAHDPDSDIQALTLAALASRGLTPAEISAGVKVISPLAADRLRLLYELRWGLAPVKDPAPWLAKLANDAEPAVRAGAVRVALELGIRTGGWDRDLAEKDVDFTVRRLAQYYREQPSAIRAVDFRP